jgi:hypothetical protein
MTENQKCTVTSRICAGQSGQRSKPDAENQRKHFCTVKFSTQLLISLWKSWVERSLTSRNSIIFSTLHYLSATQIFPRALSRAQKSSLVQIIFSRNYATVAKKLSD